MCARPRSQIRGLDDAVANVITPAGNVQLQTPLLGRGNLANVLAATATAIHFGVPLDAIRERASRLTAASHRGELLRLPGGITIIDDSYASRGPSALMRALELVAAAEGCARKITVLGEMPGSGGAHAGRLHRECGAAAAQSGLSILITVGGDGAIARGRRDCRRHAGRVRVSSRPSRTRRNLLQFVRPGDLVLVEGRAESVQITWWNSSDGVA